MVAPHPAAARQSAADDKPPQPLLERLMQLEQMQVPHVVIDRASHQATVFVVAVVLDVGIRVLRFSGSSIDGGS